MRIQPFLQKQEDKMAKKSPAEKKAASPPVDEAIMLQMYRNVYATRQFELKCAELYRAGLIRGYLHPYLGEEAILYAGEQPLCGFNPD